MIERWLIASLAVAALLLLRVVVQARVTASRGGKECGGGCMHACSRAVPDPADE